MTIFILNVIFVIFLRNCNGKTLENHPDPIAEIELLLYDEQRDGEYTVTERVNLSGYFSPAGTRASAEGDVVQLHPLIICDAVYDDDLKLRYGSVAVVKLESHEIDHCRLTVYQRAEKIIQRGATAVILDITDDLDAEQDLRQAGSVDSLERPVIHINGADAKRLMEIILNEKNAQARIKQYNQTKEVTPHNRNEFLDMGIFISFFVLIAIICLLLVVKLRWRQRRKQDSQTRQTMNALAKMRTRKYKKGDRRQREEQVVVTPSVASDGSVCAICLDEFRDGEELRIVPCDHEFHKNCVDPWLVSNKTCPLCMFDILEPEEGKVNTPSIHGTPPEQYAELRVNLPSTSAEEISQSSSINNQPSHSHYEEYPHHRHSSSNGWVHPVARRDRRPISYSGAYLREFGQCSMPGRNGPTERWVPSYSQWQPQPCDFVCSRCQRKVQKYSGKSNRRTRVVGPELTSFESHYGSSMTGQYVPVAEVSYSNGRMLSPTSRQVHMHCTPAQIHAQPPPPQENALDPNSSVMRDSSSESSLSLSAFHADYECSDSSSSQENFDSNRSVFGSSTTCRSDPVAPDPQLYAKPGIVDQEWANSAPVSLTPSCVHRKESHHLKPVRFSSDSEEVKRSGSEACASSGSNFSTKAHVSCKASPHPYKPGGNGTFIQAFMHSAKQKSHSFPRTSGGHPAHTSKRRHEHSRGQPVKTKDTRVREIKSRPCKGSSNATKDIPCHCCNGNSVWEAKGQSSRGREHRSKSIERSEDHAECSKRLRDERSGKTRSEDKVQSKSKAERHGHRTRKSRAHLSLPIQSIVTVDPVEGYITTVPVSSSGRRNTREEIV
ncbi:E3 ubiquitin-protein ligase ZNRF3 [Holothuria leucospilota]|uniref:RING-type E3 ubiquitin transferase n=1 Tax=Holothuria leucospilota TaxID=206669 RepID=A0A9Q1HG60_HOLLE|nr:E3 ubiquitin-protein ligase ZNRF3 [Holothuria leucospilota]